MMKCTCINEVYSVHACFDFYTLFLNKIFLGAMLKKVCFLEWIKTAYLLSNRKMDRGVDTWSMSIRCTLYIAHAIYVRYDYEYEVTQDHSIRLVDPVGTG